MPESSMFMMCLLSAVFMSETRTIIAMLSPCDAKGDHSYGDQPASMNQAQVAVVRRVV